MRIGHGYDAHRLKEGRPCVLCGILIPSPVGPDGHSDADVPAHALIDAIFGALCLPDIGAHFPDSDPAYKGADSIELLKAVIERLAREGYRVGNVDCTIVAQTPKLMPYLPEMRRRLAEACGVSEDLFSVKATTEERLGFTGRGEGVAAHAVALIEKTE